MNEQVTKHTPGPWKVSEKMMTDELVCRHDALGAWVHSCRYIEGTGKLLADAQSNEPIGTGYKGGHPQVESRDEMLANARLIAAAPELLALAARGASLADAVAESAYDVGKHVEDIRRLAYWALDARSAIRAAEGKG